MKVNPYFKFHGRVSDIMAAARAHAEAAETRALLALIALLIISRLTY